MNKFVKIFLIVLVIIGALFGSYMLGKNSKPKISQPRDAGEAEGDTENKNITIVNDTGKIINEIHLYLEDGTELLCEWDLDKTDNTYEVESNFENRSTFTVKMVDNYGRLYEKTETGLEGVGRYTISISKDDYVKQSGDWLKDTSEFFNNLFGGDQ